MIAHLRGRLLAKRPNQAIVETGFLTNPTDWRLLHTASYQQRVALGLANGVRAFVRR